MKDGKKGKSIPSGAAAAGAEDDSIASSAEAARTASDGAGRGALAFEEVDAALDAADGGVGANAAAGEAGLTGFHRGGRGESAAGEGEGEGRDDK